MDAVRQDHDAWTKRLQERIVKIVKADEVDSLTRLINSQDVRERALQAISLDIGAVETKADGTAVAQELDRYLQEFKPGTAIERFLRESLAAKMRCLPPDTAECSTEPAEQPAEEAMAVQVPAPADDEEIPDEEAGIPDEEAEIEDIESELTRRNRPRPDVAPHEDRPAPKSRPLTTQAGQFVRAPNVPIHEFRPGGVIDTFLRRSVAAAMRESAVGPAARKDEPAGQVIPASNGLMQPPELPYIVLAFLMGQRALSRWPELRNQRSDTSAIEPARADPAHPAEPDGKHTGESPAKVIAEDPRPLKEAAVIRSDDDHFWDDEFPLLPEGRAAEDPLTQELDEADVPSDEGQTIQLLMQLAGPRFADRSARELSSALYQRFGRFPQSAAVIEELMEHSNHDPRYEVILDAYVSWTRGPRPHGFIQSRL